MPFSNSCIGRHRVKFGVTNYQQRSANTSTLLYQLFEGFKREGIAMPYTMQDFRRDFAKEHLKDLTPEERRELFKDLSIQERLEGLSAEEIEDYLQRRKQEATSRKRK